MLQEEDETKPLLGKKQISWFLKWKEKVVRVKNGYTHLHEHISSLYLLIFDIKKI